MNNNVPRCKPLENTLQITPAIQKKKKCAFKEKLKQNHLKRHKGFEQIRGRIELILTAFKGKMDVKNEVK